MNFGNAYDIDNNEIKTNIIVEYPGYSYCKANNTTTTELLQKGNYGKFQIGRNLTNIYMKAAIIIDPTATDVQYKAISSDLFTLIRALGR